MVRRVQRIRRIVAVITIALGVSVAVMASEDMRQPVVQPQVQAETKDTAIARLATIPIKGRAPNTGYARAQFGNGWTSVGGCDTRNIILNRDLQSPVIGEGCKVLSGVLNDPYTGKIIQFKRGAGTSGEVQIDHVVALNDAWQKGAQNLSFERRKALANDPLELLAVDGKANQDKSGGDAATWLPPNKAFRCEYVARQIAVKAKYSLWVTQAEHDEMKRVLERCPNYGLPT